MGELRARLIDRWQEASLVVGVRVQPDGGFAFAAGQVVLMRAEGGPAGYFAIASAPREGLPLRFLLKEGGLAADALGDLAIGDHLWLDGPQGPGFPLTAHHGMDIVLVGVGTAIAPLRSALVEALPHRETFGRLILLYGAMGSEAFSCSGDFDAWAEAGVEIVQVADPEAEGRGWTGLLGHVQDHLEALDLNPDRTVACIAGMSAMEQSTRERLISLGVPDARVLTNY